MSNFLAIATVTSTLGQLLQDKALRVLDDEAKVTIGRPKEGVPKGINLFLYQVNFNPYLRNTDLTTRRSDATLSQRPLAAVDLYYLLSFYGAESDLEPQIFLGSAISALHAQPILTRDNIRKEIERRKTENPDDKLLDSDLAEDIETVKFMPLSINIEEIAKLWSIFFNIPYTLSVAYMASAVLIESPIQPQKALPVRSRDIEVRPFNRPLIEKIRSAEGDTAPVIYNSIIVISGQRLKGDPTQIRLGKVVVTLDPADSVNTVNDNEIRLSLDSTLFLGQAMRAGVQDLQILHPVMMGDPKVEHRGFESNGKSITLRPVISHDPQISDVMTVTFIPQVGIQQKVEALLNEIDYGAGIPRSYVIAAPLNNGIVTDSVIETGSINFPVENVKPGTYLLRARVDGAESPLEVNSDPANPSRIKKI